MTVYLAAALALLAAPAPPSRESAIAAQKEAVQLVRQAAEAAAAQESPRFARALTEAAARIDALLAAAPSLTAAERTGLERAAETFRKRSREGPAGFVADEEVDLLERVGSRLRTPAAVTFDFEGGYGRPKLEQPAYGGHATAMGPAPVASAAAGGPPSVVRFEEVPGQLTEKTFGGGPSKLHLVESGGNGVALVDYDGDGRLDVYVVNGPELDEANGRRRVPHPNALYRNLGALRFENVATRAGVAAAAWGYGVCAGDYDGDGRPDLYVTNYGPNLLYRNKGDGTFEEKAAAAGLEAGGWSTGCAFLDADRDGDLDLYVARYVTVDDAEVAAPRMFLTWRGVAKVMLGPAGLPGAADLFFENRGDGTFVEQTDARGLADRARAYGFGVVATDYDGDGWVDLFVANDSNPNFLYRNRGGRFESVGLAAGVALSEDGRAQAGMGADAGDFDGDGRIDLGDTTFAFDHNSLFRNAGGGGFEDVSQRLGLTAATHQPMSWGMAFLDADLDGDLDVYYANGHLFPQVDAFAELGETYGQRDQLFLNEKERFRDVSDTAGAGLALRKCSRGLAVGDLDDDGDPDLVVSAMDDVPSLLENRQQTGRHWVGLQLRGPQGNRLALGARVTVTDATGRAQVREVRSGGGYLSQNDLRALVGLGDEKGPVSVEVTLGDARWRWDGVPVDRYTVLTLDDERRADTVP